MSSQAIQGLLVNSDPRLNRPFYFQSKSSGKFLNFSHSQFYRIIEMVRKSWTIRPKITKWELKQCLEKSKWSYADFFTPYYIQDSESKGYLVPNAKYNGVELSKTKHIWWAHPIGKLRFFTNNQKGRICYLIEKKDKITLSEPLLRADIRKAGPGWDLIENFKKENLLKNSINNLICSKQHDATFPEDNYEGSMLDTYKTIIELLGGIEPKSGKIKVSNLDAINAQKPNPLPDHWNEVMAHLFKEVTYFERLDDWFGAGGNIRSLIETITIGKLGIIGTIENTSNPKKESLAEILLGLFFELIQIGLESTTDEVPGASTTIGAIGSIWDTFNDATGGRHDTLNSTFKDLYKDLTNIFEKIVTQIETSHSEIKKNWSKLSDFNDLVLKPENEWPSKTDSIRNIAGFHFAIMCWKAVAASKWSLKYMPNSSSKRTHTEAPPHANQVYIQYKFGLDKHNKPIYRNWYVQAPDEVKKMAEFLFGKYDINNNDFYPDNLGVNQLDFVFGLNGWSLDKFVL